MAVKLTEYRGCEIVTYELRPVPSPIKKWRSLGFKGDCLKFTFFPRRPPTQSHTFQDG